MDKKKQKFQLSLLDLVSIGIGMVIGSGVVGLIGPAVALTGRSAGLAYIAAVVLGLVSILPSIFISSAINVRGGEYTIVKTMMGDMLSGIYIWNFILTHIALASTGLAMGAYIQAIFPQADVNVCAFLVVGLFYVINLFGLKFMNRIQGIMVIFLLAALFIFCFISCGHLMEGSFAIGSGTYYIGGFTGFISAAVLLTSSTNSHQLMLGLGGDVGKAKEKLPKAIFITSGIILIIYGFVGFAAANVLPYEQVAGRTLTVVAQAIMPPWLFVFFMIAGPMLAICSTFNGLFPAVAKTLQKAALDGWFPRKMAAENRRGACYWFMTILFIVAVIPILLGLNIQSTVYIMLLVININKIILLISAFKLPFKYPEHWKASRMHVPLPVYFFLIILAAAAQILLIVTSAANLTPVIIGVSLILIAILSTCAIIRYKTGKVKPVEDDSLGLSSEKEEQAAENAG